MFLTALMLMLNAILLAWLSWRAQHFKNLAFYDPLTGLANRRLFEDRLEQALKHARRHRTGVAVLFLDLDHFKRVNDVHGHPTGDRLLRAVAQRLCECVRETDTVARRGGDEFTVLLTDLTDPDAAGRIAQRIVATLQKPFSISVQPIRIGASVGIRLCDPDEPAGPQPIADADRALYEAKRQGRGRYHVFAPFGGSALAAA
ncbi:MAG TPA: GGDEF domain-containing protein [Candidatus Competibacter sp.]|nr:GGDEF domain-containing protein [Candidatus Competibacter sp.]